MRINETLAKKWKMQKIIFGFSIVFCVIFVTSAVFVGIAEQDRIIPSMTIIIAIIALAFSILSLVFGIRMNRTKKEIMLKDYA